MPQPPPELALVDVVVAQRSSGLAADSASVADSIDLAGQDFLLELVAAAV